ncbi:MAG: tetratricopeptide repeat protein, partial [Myxococcota bacterium]
MNLDRSVGRPSTSAGVIIALAALAAPLGSASAQLPGQPGFRTQAQQRDELVGKLKRDIAKVAHSVEVTKELIARSRGAPFLPDIYLRLAELYVEQARYEFYLVHELRGESSKGSAIAPTAKLLKEKAVEIYLRILSEFPRFEDSDKVLFFLAHEYRELGDYRSMIQRYEELVSKYSKSPLVLDAYLVLGDYRFDRSDLAGAKRYYSKILDAPESSATPMAHFKMGWVYLNESDYREALRQFQAAVVADVKLADAAQATRDRDDKRVDVTREALTDLAYAYTEVYKPRSALKYFRRLAPTRNMYRLALEKLARRYFVKQDFSSAAMVYREIARLSYDAETNLDFTSRIYESTKTIQSYGRVHADVEAMLTALNGYRFDWRVADAQRKAATQDFEVFTRDLSTRAQAQAIKSKNNRQQLRVALAYTRYLDSFPESVHRRDMVQNLADTLFEAKLYLRAGDRYEEAAQLARKRKDKEAALYSACASFYEVLKNSSKLPRFDRIWAQQGLIRNGVAYVESFPKSRRVPQIKLNIGRSYYEAGQFEQAVGVFDEFLEAYPRHKGAQAVAELILDTYAQRQDFAGLSEKARELRRRKVGSARFQSRLTAMAKQAEERQIGEVILTASIQEGGRDAGAQLRKYWERNKSSPVAEKTLYTAFVQFKEARNFEKTFETGNQFIGAYPQSQYLGDVFGTLASFTSQTGEYEQAAVYLEEYYKRFPNDSTAQRTLAQAAAIKQLIGDHRGAVRAYGRLVSTVRNRSERRQYAAKMLESYEALGDWDGVQNAAAKVLRIDARSVRARLMLGLAAEKGGDLGQALEHYRAAVRSARRGADDQDMDDAARAAFLAGDAIFKRFQRVSGEGNVSAAAEAKAEFLADLEDAMVNVVGYNRGRWAVAALHRVALAYQSFARFLRSAPIPSDLAPEQQREYRQVVNQQAEGIEARAKEYFATCMTKARELNVFSGAVLGCSRRGPEQRVPEVRLSRATPPKQRFETLKDALTKDPKNIDALGELADYFLMSGEPAKAKLAASRGLEIDDRAALLHNKLGMADLLLGDPQEAFFAFRRAVDLGHPYAAANEAALRVTFGD